MARRRHTAYRACLGRNVASIEASPEAIWRLLVDAEKWPDWYPYARDVRIIGREAELREGSLFDWVTFGVSVRSRVTDYAPYDRIAWTASAIGTEAYHAWRIDVIAAGRCRVVTEETQRGWAPHLLAPILRRRLRRQHEVWLEHLKALSIGMGETRNP